MGIQDQSACSNQAGYRQGQIVMTNSKILVALAVCSAAGGWSAPVGADVVTEWNATTLNCVQGAGPTIPANRAGPPGLLDIALVQAAVHDAVQAIEGRFEPYHFEDASLKDVGSVEAAAAAAAYQTLVGLYGAGVACLASVTDPSVTYAGDPGLQAGNAAAAALLPLRRPTQVLPTDPFTGGTEPGQWRPTPGVIAGTNTFMAVTAPFVMLRPSQFRPEPPPPLSSRRYAREYDEVKSLGSATDSARDEEQTDLARFWSANFIVQWYATLRSIADAHVPDVGDKARLFALAGLAMADSQISVYDAKYLYNYWRPVTAIREGDNDGNDRTIGDATWAPLLGTPPYPEYHSGANLLSGSFTGILRLYFGTDEFDFSVSSPVAGVTTNPRQYHCFSQAAREIVEVRIFQGIHFRSADVEGRRQGRRLAHWTFKKYLRPIRGHDWK
jgi:hypothetical protein